MGRCYKSHTKNLCQLIKNVDGYEITRKLEVTKICPKPIPENFDSFKDLSQIYSWETKWLQKCRGYKSHCMLLHTKTICPKFIPVKFRKFQHYSYKSHCRNFHFIVHQKKKTMETTLMVINLMSNTRNSVDVMLMPETSGLKDTNDQSRPKLRQFMAHEHLQ